MRIIEVHSVQSTYIRLNFVFVILIRIVIVLVTFYELWSSLECLYIWKRFLIRVDVSVHELLDFYKYNIEIIVIKK